MNVIVETKRLYLREVCMDDVDDLYEMDADAEVHKYIENKPVTTKQQIIDVISMLQQQYRENGIARWAVIDKDTNECLGWAGLKYYTESLNNHHYFYELGYRFKRKHWNKGYATEACTAIINYGFTHLNTNVMYAITHIENNNSINVLKKLGFQLKETFDYDNELVNWFELTKNQSK